MELRICEVDKGCGDGSEGNEGWLAKRRALFPEGRGLGVGGRKRKRKRKRESKSKIGCSLRKADEARVDGLD